MIIFKTHKGDIVPINMLKKACHKVACDMEENAKSIYDSDPYASHVTKQQKLEMLQKSYDDAEDVRQLKNLHNFTIWQRVNYEITGECIALLSK